MRRRTAPLDAIALVARHLGPLADSVAFLGGAVVDLLLTDPAAPPARVTQDVDLIIEIATRRAYWALERDLTARGFAPDEEDGIICRWVVAGTKVDVMPTDSAVLGFGNRWYAPAVRSAERHLLDDVAVRVVTAPYFIATKLEAFADHERSAGDFFASSDIQDMVALADGRPELVAEVEAAPDDVREYIARSLADALAEGDFETAVSGHLPPDDASQERTPVVLARLRKMARPAR